MEKVLISGLDLHLVSQMPDFSRGSVIDPADIGVKSTYATKARSQRNLSHWQSRLVDKPLRKVQTPCLSHGNRRRPQVSQEQAAKVARANSQAFRQNFNSTVLQATFTDQPQSPRNGV
jgi:hypothetical protein